MMEETEPQDKEQVLKRILAEREALDAALGRLAPDQWTLPGLEAQRSVKDIMCHVAAWERLMVRWLEDSLQGTAPDRPAPGMPWEDLDAINERIYEENKDRSLEDVKDDSRRAFAEALESAGHLTDDDLFRADRFAWRNGDPMWHMVAANTWMHYREHRQEVTAWVSSQT
jgi:hypothetical protein